MNWSSRAACQREFILNVPTPRKTRWEPPQGGVCHQHAPCAARLVARSEYFKQNPELLETYLTMTLQFISWVLTLDPQYF